MGDLQERTRFEPAEVEPRILARWLQDGFVHPEAAGTAAENFSIAIPPPNVTGALHMGHALNGTIQDVLVRTNRMRGRRTKWILGTDHAGIATQRQVEKLLESEGTSRTELGREEFVRRVWGWRDEYGGQIIEQFKRLGATCDYEDERFTLDAQYAEAVLKVFVDLLPGTDRLLATSALPAPDRALRDPAAEAQMERAIEAVRVLRGWRDSVGVRPGAIVPAVLNAEGYETTAGRVGALARFAFNGGVTDGGAAEVASVAVPGGTVAVLESGDVDLGAAERRVEERRATLRNEIERAERKLANEGFVAKAPPAVVESERAKLERLRAELEAL